MSVSNVQEKAAPYGIRVEAPAEQRVVLHGVSWATFEALLKDLGDNRACRLAYDRGELEIMSPLPKHETSTLSIHDNVVSLIDLLDLEYVGMGHFTCKREDLLRGLEPDCCYYIQNEPLVRGKDEIDLTIDPPPDLMVEVDITNSSIDKLSLCAALGVKEHWRYAGERLEIRMLKRGAYVEVDFSPIFPNLDLKSAVPKFIKQGRDAGRLRALRAFREWVRGQLKSK